MMKDVNWRHNTHDEIVVSVLCFVQLSKVLTGERVREKTARKEGAQFLRACATKGP